jgi:hypothetical protein
MHPIYIEELYRARLAERLAEIDLSTAPVRMRPANRRRRLGRRRRPAGNAATA